MCGKRVLLICLVASALLLAVGVGPRLSGADTMPISQAAAATWTLQGRVFEGNIGDETRPLSGVTVSVYGANDPYPDEGELIESTTTNGEGWYGLDVSRYEYYHIRETDPSSYTSVGATTVSGTVQTENWIQYVVPLEGKTLTGNKFWDRPPVLSGRVYQGDVGDESTPLAGVIVELYCSDDAGFLGSQIDSTTTDAEGWYRLWAYSGCEFYNIVETDPPDYVSIGATTVSGTVQTENWIQYVVPLEGKTWTGNKFWDQPEPSDPDLVINDLWNEGTAICYQIMNVGSGAAPTGHVTALIVDGSDVFTNSVEMELGPDQRYERCFDWSCSGAEDSIEAQADSTEVVPESDEGNNFREEFWQCDITPPEIISGPVASEITDVSAIISWRTDEDGDSLVRYGETVGVYDFEETDPARVTVHSVMLGGLDPSTTYNFAVQSTDANGNTVQSQDRIFTTEPAPDSVDPSVLITVPEELEGSTVLTATASDDMEVHKVEFLIDGELVFVDYSSPYELPLDTHLYENGLHNLVGRAYDNVGNSSICERPVNVANLIDETAPSVSITYPAQDGATVSGKISVTADLADDVGLAQIFFKVSQQAKVWHWGFDNLPSHPKNATVSFEWDTTQVPNGQYHLGIGVYDTEGKYGSATRDVVVNQAAALLPAKLKIIQHELTRMQHAVKVTLVVKNVGDETASNVRIEDILQGFQPISRTTTVPVVADYRVEYDAYHREAECQITSYTNIGAGQVVTYTYHAAPVLFYPNPPTPSVGSVTYLHYDRPGGPTIHDPVAVPVPQSTVATVYDDALKEANYLIVTNPTRLFQFGYPQTEAVQGLLSDMAQLAVYQQGVLGFLGVYDIYTLNDLIKPSLSTKIPRAGQWGTRLRSDFRTALGGSMLIVGEGEIVPWWITKGWNRHWTGDGVTNNVNMTDRPYADTTGDGAPELIVGRIIGDSPSDMATAIQTSVRVYEGQAGYGFDRSNALIVSGTGTGQSTMVKGANDTESAATSKGFTVDLLHWSTYSSTQRLTQFTNRTPNQDVIYINDHGTPDCLGEVCTWNVPNLNFGSTNPLVLAISCSTGDYEDGNDSNIAEAFLEHGAGVYIGSPEWSPIPLNAEAGKRFFNTWGSSTDDTVGRTLTEMERDRWSHGKWWQFWVEEYNLYGDPKYWAPPPGPTATIAPQQVLTAPVSPLEIEVPDYEVTTFEGADYVKIPDGDVLYEEGEPQVPYYSVSYDYSAGYQIQDVILIGRTGLVTDTGLDLPLTTMDINASRGAVASAGEGGEGWFPEEQYGWDVRQNPDGTITLIVMVYPFYYNSATTGVEFYKNYSFEIVYTFSDVAVTSLTTDQDAYQQGDVVLTDIEIENLGEAQEVVVSAQIKRYGSEEVVDGLLLHTLQGLVGSASFSPQWDSSGVDSGHYFVEVTLKDGGGNVLDRESEKFRLGIPYGEITSFTATPEYFEIGDNIVTSLVFSNTGTVSITGTVVIEVRSETGETVQEFGHDVTDLAPAEAVNFDDTWYTSGEEEGTYSVVGYVSYDGMTTDPMKVEVSTERRIYLPLVSRNYP